MFASDEEALAAAEAAYRNYIAVSEQIARDGGAGAARLEPFVSAELFLQESQVYADALSRGLRATGASTFDSFSLESYDRQSETIRIYVCLRTVEITVLDANAIDVTPVGRNNNLPLQIEFLGSTNLTSQIQVSESNVWAGTNFC